MSSTVRLREIGSTYGGLTGKSKADFGRGDARFVTFLEVINSTRLSGRALERVEVKKGERQNRVKCGDVLFNGSSETPEEVALSAVVDFDSNIVTFLNSFCFGFRLRPDAAVDPTYLAYFFRSSAGRSLVSSLAQGATRYNIAKTKFLDVELALPSFERQHEIVEWLNDADDMVATLERLIAKKQAIKQGMMQQLLTGRTRLPGFTGQWAQLHAGDLGTFKGGSGFAPRFQGSASGPIPFFKVSDMNNSGNELFMRRANNYVTDAQRNSMGAVLMPTDAIIFAKVGAAVFLERKRILTTPSCIDNNMAAYVVDACRVNVRFMHYVMSAFPMSSLVATGALPSLNGSQLRSIPIALPELDEQVAIAGVLADTDDEVNALQHRLSKARAIKAGMMQQLLTGRVRLPVEASA